MENRFKDALVNGEFCVTCEIIPGRGAREDGQEKEFAEAKRIYETGRVHAMSITDNPGGNPALLADTLGKEFLDQGMVPLVHFTCKDRSRNQIMAQLYSIFGFLLDNVMPETRAEAVTPELYLVRTLDFIDTNYFEKITIEDIAAGVGVSRKTLAAVFSSLTGFTPKDYLIYYRLSKAVDLLRDTSMSIDTIASSVGYNDQFYFSKQFKTNVGMTPSECRRLMAADPTWRFQSPIDHVRQQYRAPSSNEKPPKF